MQCGREENKHHDHCFDIESLLYFGCTLFYAQRNGMVCINDEIQFLYFTNIEHWTILKNDFDPLLLSITQFTAAVFSTMKHSTNELTNTHTFKQAKRIKEKKKRTHLKLSRNKTIFYYCYFFDIELDKKRGKNCLELAYNKRAGVRTCCISSSLFFLLDSIWFS